LHIILQFFVLGLLIVGLVVGILLIVLLLKLLKESSGGGDKHGLLQIHPKTKFEKQEAIGAKTLKERKRLRGEDGTPSVTEPKKNKEWSSPKPVFVIRFDGDLLASSRKVFAEIVDEIIVNKTRVDGTVIVVSSPGGGVAHYGQMYSEMERIREAAIPLTVCVDTYAASGGYLMSLPANKIVAAPYAVVGSIGVVAELVNAHQFLKGHGLEPLTLTAGRYKRTVTPLSPITEEGKQHMQEHLEAIHRLFIESVKKYREVDPGRVCNGDFWTAQESVNLDLGLVDELGTSQAYLYRINQTQDLIVVSQKKNMLEQGSFKITTAMADHLLNRILSGRWFY
jgi:serine protease SohB